MRGRHHDLRRIPVREPNDQASADRKASQAWTVWSALTFGAKRLLLLITKLARPRLSESSEGVTKSPLQSSSRRCCLLYLRRKQRRLGLAQLRGASCGQDRVRQAAGLQPRRRLRPALQARVGLDHHPDTQPPMCLRLHHGATHSPTSMLARRTDTRRDRHRHGHPTGLLS